MGLDVLILGRDGMGRDFEIGMGWDGTRIFLDWDGMGWDEIF